jgi:hypothetical protein
VIPAADATLSSVSISVTECAVLTSASGPRRLRKANLIDFGRDDTVKFQLGVWMKHVLLAEVS